MTPQDLRKAADCGHSAAALAEVPRQPGQMESWIRRVNDRWLVHSGLNVQARAYLDHLAATDPMRLARTCRIVHQLMALHDPCADPKPWFYGGLFCLANATEVNLYLDKHRFTRMLHPGTREETMLSEARDLELAEDVVARVRHIRAKVREQAAHDPHQP